MTAVVINMCLQSTLLVEVNVLSGCLWVCLGTDKLHPVCFASYYAGLVGAPARGLVGGLPRCTSQRTR
jgi:hypothetical protein